VLDKQGNKVNTLLTDKRDNKAANHFLTKAIGKNIRPGIINIDKSGANKASIKAYNKINNTRIEIRQYKYLNNIIEQVHRFIKRKTKLVLGFKNYTLGFLIYKRFFRSHCNH